MIWISFSERITLISKIHCGFHEIPVNCKITSLLATLILKSDILY